MMDNKCIKVHTKAFKGQKADAEGLRKPMKVFLSNRDYTEIFVQCSLSAMDDKIVGSSLVVGGDGSDLCSHNAKNHSFVCS